MANNQSIFNAALCGASGGAQERWLKSTSAADYTNFAAAMLAFATAVDAAIAPATISDGQAQLMQSLCQGVVSNRFPQSRNTSDYTDIAAVIASLYNVLAVSLFPGSLGGFLPRGQGAVFETFDKWSQNEVWAPYFMTAAEQADYYAETLLFDLQPKFQLAIDYAQYRNSPSGVSGGPKVKAGGGVARIDRPIQVGYGVDIRSCIFEGEGMRFGGSNGVVGSGTAFVPTFNNAPAIVVQGGYYSQLRDFSIFGPNQDWVTNHVLNNNNMANLNVSQWVDPSFPVSASSQFAVQCGIAIDPYSGPQPAVHYPDAVYPVGFPQTQYNKAPSSNVKIENVYIAGCVACVALQPCNFDGNGDFIRLENVTMFFSAWGFVWGNSQARTTTLHNCTGLGMNTYVDNKTFGTQRGDAQIILQSVQVNIIIRWVNMTMSDGQGPLFEHCFSETTYQIGTIGTNSSFSGECRFINCNFGMSFWEAYGVPASIFGNGGSQTLAVFEQVRFFLNTALTAFDAWGAIHMTTGGQTELGNLFEFNQCETILPSGEPTQLWAKCILNATQGLSISTGNTRFQRYSWRTSHKYNLDTGADLGTKQYGRLNTGDRPKCLPAYGEKMVNSQSGADAGVDITWRIGGPTATGVPVVAGRNVTITYNGSWNADAANRLGGDVGDFIIDAVNETVIWVYTRTGNVVSGRAMNNYDNAGNLLVNPPNNAGFWGVNCRRYTPDLDQAIYGDVTAGSNVITNIISGTGANIAMTGRVAIGDWFYQEQDIDKIFVSDAACKITNIDDVAHTITMGGNAVRNITHMRLALFTRAPMPNGTPPG